MEKFQRSALIFSCSNGHFLCGACRSHSSIEVINIFERSNISFPTFRCAPSVAEAL